MAKKINKKEIIGDITERLRKRYHPEKVILFGSFAYGNPSMDSDLDFLIIKKTTQRPIDRRVTVRRMVADLRKGVPFSPIVVTPSELHNRLKIDDQFFQEIVMRGKVLYAKR